MARKLTTAECVFTVMAYLNLIVAVIETLGAILSFLGGNPVPAVLCAILWMETVVMFKGLEYMDFSCMKLIKWLNVSKCAFMVVLRIWMRKLVPADSIKGAGIDVESFYTCIIIILIIGMVKSIFIACLAHHLENFYETLQNNRQDDALEVVTGNVSVDQSPTQGIATAKPNPVAEKAQPKDVLSQV